MSVRILSGDMTVELPKLVAAGERFHAVVTDPPYHLTTIVKRFGKEGSAPAQFGTDGAFARASRGFMGKSWDGGDIAFRPETWRLVLDAMLPGAHLVCFGGTRTWHRLACAIEDAGFQIRDTLCWLYGSGVPKSLDVSKAIDKRGGKSVAWFGPWLRTERERRGITQKDLAAHFPSRTGNLTGCVANWELGLNQPTAEQFNTLCQILAVPFERLEEAKREVIATSTCRAESTSWFTSDNGHNITAPATDAARQWAGWGTALKPAWEGVILARKPLDGTVADNVLNHGCGALNIEASRIGTTGEVPASSRRGAFGEGYNFGPPLAATFDTNIGRWPANVLHDGSDEVLAAFAEYGESRSSSTNSVKRKTGTGHQRNVYGKESRPSGTPLITYGDTGSVARFFWSSKADAADRAGSKHPTVKPTDLVRYLIRLITPPNRVEMVCESCYTPTHDKSHLPAMRGCVSKPPSSGEVLLNAVQSNRHDNSTDPMPLVREDSCESARDILFGGLPEPSGAASKNLTSSHMQPLPNDLQAEEEWRKEILQPEVRSDGQRSGKEKDQYHNGQRIHSALSAEPSDGQQAGLCDGTQIGNGRAFEASSGELRSGASHQRSEERQQNRKPVVDDEGRSRPDEEAANKDDDIVPPLPGTHKTEQRCPKCGGALKSVVHHSVVLDPFAGTGTTGLAADQLGFDAVLIEQDATYVEDAKRKISSDAPLFAGVAVE